MNPNAGDCRRATALVVHYGNSDLGGVNALLHESVEANRVTPTVIALLDFYQQVVPQFVTELGMATLSEVVLDLAQNQDADEDCRRAAGLIAHHANSNVDGINSVLQSAAEADRVTELVIGVLSLYETLVPPLYSPAGLRALQQTVLNLAAREAAG